MVGTSGPGYCNETQITTIGNLTTDPELRFTPAGVAVVKFTVASTPRTFDRVKNEWVDGDPLFLNCTAWRDLAEHIAESLVIASSADRRGD